MEAYYAEAMEGFEEDDAFYEGLLDEFIETPDGVPVTIPTTARAVVDEAVDNVNPQDVLVKYAPRKMSKGAEQDADIVRQWAHGLVTHWRQQGGDIDFIRDFLKNLFRSGKAVFKVAPDWSLWPTLDKAAEDELREQGPAAIKERVETIKRVRAENVPFYCVSLPPQCVMEDPTVGGRKLWVIERYQGRATEVANTYSVDVEDFRTSMFQRDIIIHEIWSAAYVDYRGRPTPGRHWVFANNQLIRNDENPSGVLPYIIKYSGYGRDSFESRPELKAVGFYTRQNKSMFLAEARRFTHFDAIMSQLAFPLAFLEDNVDPNAISFAPGALNFVPSTVLENIDKLWVTPEIPHPEYLSSLNLIGNQIERGTVQRALRGAGVPGTDSAAQYNALASQSKLRIESCKQAAEQGLSGAVSRVLRHIDLDFNGAVSMYVGDVEGGKNYKLSSKNIQGHYAVQIEFQPNEDSIKERKLVIANDAMTKGGMSPYDAYVFAGFDNPTEMMARKEAYELMQEPLIKRALAKRTLKEWGEDIEMLEMEEQMAQGVQQFNLQQFMNQLFNGGSATGMVDPATGGAPPPEEPPMDPNMMVPMGGPPNQSPQGGGMPMPAGAPPAADPGMVGALQGINTLGSV